MAGQRGRRRKFLWIIAIGGIKGFLFGQEVLQFMRSRYRQAAAAILHGKLTQLLQIWILLENFLQIGGVFIQIAIGRLDNRAEFNNNNYYYG